MADNAIDQPVLQCRLPAASHGGYWAVPTWYLDGSETYYNTSVNLSAGTELHGRNLLKSYSGSHNDYIAEFQIYMIRKLKAKNADDLVWAAETLEVYKVPKTDS